MLINFGNDEYDAADDNKKDDENNDDVFMRIKLDVIKRRFQKYL